jgi:hypothetical protein
MDARKRERSKKPLTQYSLSLTNYTRIDDDTRELLKERWFPAPTYEDGDEEEGASDQEEYARSKLREAKSKGYSPELKLEMIKALDANSLDGMTLLQNWINERNVEEHTRYYVAYESITDRDRLHMFILYSIKKDYQILYVEYMGIACQGVWEAVKQGARNRNKLHDLFKNSIQSIQTDLEDTRYAVARIKINVATNGSASVMKATFRRDFVSRGEYVVNIVDICSNCQIGAPILTLKHVGGGYCSQKCAKQFWEALAWMEHPITESCFITF